MSGKISVVGVHPIDAPQPCHLLEIAVSDPDDKFRWADVTQEEPGQPRGNWQAAYDESLVGAEGPEKRFAFFFHYLDLAKPLLTSFGPVELPSPTPTPAHLKHIEYIPVY